MGVTSRRDVGEIVFTFNEASIGPDCLVSCAATVESSMFEFFDTLVSSASYLNIVDVLRDWSATDMMVLFLLSKPLFVIIAIGAIFSGRKWGETHYLHCQDCDRFLSQAFGEASEGNGR